MKEKVYLSLKQFLSLLRSDVDSFEAHWQKYLDKPDPEHPYPDKLPIGDWYEQFEFWQEGRE